VQGDLHEEFDYQLQRVGLRNARLRYWRDVLGFAKPFALKRKQTTYPPSSFFHFPMLRSYLTIALRTLWRSKGYTAINVVGLSVAFCTSLFLLLMAYLQLTFDAFHADGDRIFQTYFFTNHPEGASRSGSMPLPLLPALKAEHPEVEAARLVMGRTSLVEYRGKYLDKEVYYTDPDFFNIFSFSLRKGSPQTALNTLSSIVISESLARATFGDEDPMGKQLLVGSKGNQKGYLVTGVLADAPYNSSIRYDALVRVENQPGYHAQKGQWDAYSHRVFVKLAPGTARETFEKQLKAFARKYYPGTFDELKSKGAKPDARGDLFALRLQKLSTCISTRKVSDGKGVPRRDDLPAGGHRRFFSADRLHQLHQPEHGPFVYPGPRGGRAQNAGRPQRASFSPRSGANRHHLLRGTGSGCLLYVLLPLSTPHSTRGWPELRGQPAFPGLMLGMFAVVTLAGGYPAWQMAVQPGGGAEGQKYRSKQPGVLRNSLLVRSLSISACLPAARSLPCSNWTTCASSRSGFEKEQVISIPVGNHADGRQVLQRLRDKLAGDPAVVHYGQWGQPGQGQGPRYCPVGGQFYPTGKQCYTDWLLVDYDYLKTLAINCWRPRLSIPPTPPIRWAAWSLPKAWPEDGEKQPVGQGVRRQGRAPIIGVVPISTCIPSPTSPYPLPCAFPIRTPSTTYSCG
jgi:hypothetical protein